MVPILSLSLPLPFSPSPPPSPLHLFPHTNITRTPTSTPHPVYIIGGDGTMRGASLIAEEARRRQLKMSVVGIPKTVDNDIPIIDKSFGFETAVEAAQDAINSAVTETQSFPRGVGIVQLMGRLSGFIAMHATLGSRDVDCVLIPEVAFTLSGDDGLLEFLADKVSGRQEVY